MVALLEEEKLGLSNEEQLDQSKEVWELSNGGQLKDYVKIVLLYSILESQAFFSLIPKAFPNQDRGSWPIFCVCPCVHHLFRTYNDFYGRFVSMGVKIHHAPRHLFLLLHL